MKKPRIIWLIDGLGSGGAENLTLSILKRFDKKKYHIRVCVIKEKPDSPIKAELEKSGISVDMVRMPSLRNPSNLPKLLRYLRLHRPHLIHAQLQFSTIFGNIAGVLLQIPCVSTLHTVGKPTRRAAYLRNQINWFILRNFCTKIIAVSEDTRSFHMSEGKIPETKIITIYNGIELSTFKPSDKIENAKKREEFNLPADAKIISTVAVLRKPKGIQYMIEAMPAIIESAPNCKYMIVGDGEYGGALRELVREKELEKHIVFTGQQKDISTILAISDLFVLPTLTEALPTVLIEAMAAGKAIIASKVGGIPEMIEDGLNGILIPASSPSDLAKACLRLIDDDNLRNRMAEKSLEIANQKFDIQKLIQSLNNLYDELIRNGR